jgi:hypothetical protein
MIRGCSSRMRIPYLGCGSRISDADPGSGFNGQKGTGSGSATLHPQSSSINSRLKKKFKTQKFFPKGEEARAKHHLHRRDRRDRSAAQHGGGRLHGRRGGGPDPQPATRRDGRHGLSGKRHPIGQHQQVAATTRCNENPIYVFLLGIALPQSQIPTFMCR